MRHNPVILKNRKQINPMAQRRKVDPSWFPTMKQLSLLMLIFGGSTMLSGCWLLPVRVEERVVIQRVEVPVATQCPVPTVPPRATLPSVQENQKENYPDIKGCILNQDYLMHRVQTLEDLLKVYQNQSAVSAATKGVK